MNEPLLVCGTEIKGLVSDTLSAQYNGFLHYINAKEEVPTGLASGFPWLEKKKKKSFLRCASYLDLLACAVVKLSFKVLEFF